ncbi:MAG: hypothetical protein ACKOBG_06790, partial [Actinomycetota bacterium]
MTATSFWPTQDHWSCAIPLATPHPRLEALAPTGFVALTDRAEPVPETEYRSLTYMDWKSGGDTHFAPIASADGELDCRGFWSAEHQHPDKEARLTTNAALAPAL